MKVIIIIKSIAVVDDEEDIVTLFTKVLQENRYNKFP